MFKYFVLGSAFFIAICAAFFSVTGIGSLFIGAPISAMLMASSLELAKLVSVSFIYRYWEVIGKTLRSYFLIAATILMMITSIGIYGYLSSAYAVASSGISDIQNQIHLVTTQSQSFQTQIDRLEGRSKALESIRTHQETRLDSLVGKRGLRDQQKVVAQSEQQVSDIQTQLTKLSNSRDSLAAVKVGLENSIAKKGKVGTFYYIAQAIGVSLDKIIMWFILAIVLVFDPLSVSLILAYNIIKKSEETENIPELPISHEPLKIEHPFPSEQEKEIIDKIEVSEEADVPKITNWGEGPKIPLLEGTPVHIPQELPQEIIDDPNIQEEALRHIRNGGQSIA